jgi:diacylglycerol kinase (ATP)
VARSLQAVFVAGGDGTVGLVAKELAGSETALGVLPSGTANVWARELGLPGPTLITPQAIEQAAKRLAAGTIRQVDLGVCNRRSFLLWAGIGLDGKVVNSLGPRQPWSRGLLKVQHAILTLWEAVGWSGIDLGVEALGRRWDGRYIVAVISNIRAYAGGLLELSPEAKVDDGLLDFWLLKGSNLGDAVGWVIEILLGAHVVDPNVVHFQSDSATFESDERLPMQLDGEAHATRSPVHFSVRPRSVKVLVPEGGWPPLFSGAPDISSQDAS